MISKKLFLTERLILSKISTISSKKEVLLSEKISAKYLIIYTVQLQYVCKTKFTYLIKYKWHIISQQDKAENTGTNNSKPYAYVR